MVAIYVSQIIAALNRICTSCHNCGQDVHMRNADAAAAVCAAMRPDEYGGRRPSYPCVYVTEPAKINHVSKNYIIL